MALGVDQVAYSGVTGVADLGGFRIVSGPFFKGKFRNLFRINRD